MLNGKYRLALLAAVLVTIFDQASKYLIIAYVGLYESFSIIPGFFDIIHVQNPGAAFGIFAGQAPEIRNIVLIGASVTAVCVILFLFYSTPSFYHILSIGYGLILGGAVGNMIDRVQWGYVVDFIDIYIGASHWPAFNIADSAISIGMLIFFYYVIFRKVPV